MYEKRTDTIVRYVNEKEWNKAQKNVDQMIKNWESEKNLWYLALDHESFDQIYMYMNIVKKSINIKNAPLVLEQSELIKGHLSNIQGNVNYGISYIF